MSAKYLVLGGTGAMGEYLVDILSKSNQVHVTSRKEHQSKGNIIYHKGNAHDKSFLTQLSKELGNIDAIIDFMYYDLYEFKSKCDFFLSICKQYIFISSSRVYANKKGELVETDERMLDVLTDKSYLETNDYALEKAREEDLLRKQGKKNWTIIRPYLTFNEFRLQLGTYGMGDWLYRAMHGRTIVMSNEIADRCTTLTNGFDVAIAIASLLGKEETFGETYHITCNQPLKWREILDIYTDVLKSRGFDVRIKYVDKCLLYPEWRKWQALYDRCYDRIFDNSKIGRYVDISKFHDIKESLTDCLSSYLISTRSLKPDWGTQARLDRTAGERADKTEFQGIGDYYKYLSQRYIPMVWDMKSIFKEYLKRMLGKRVIGFAKSL